VEFIVTFLARFSEVAALCRDDAEAPRAEPDPADGGVAGLRAGILSVPSGFIAPVGVRGFLGISADSIRDLGQE
jgi:hypothetical protein